MALQAKVKVLKHFQYKKNMRVPGEEISIDTDDAKVLADRGKVELIKPEKVKEDKQPA